MTNELPADGRDCRWTGNLAHSRAVKTTICEEAARLCGERYRSRLLALVLTGSLAREEATFVEEGSYCGFLSDAEFLLIFDGRVSLPSPHEIELLCQSIESGLSRLQTRCHISLSPSHPDYLRRLQPSMFAYELKACGEVILGDPHILSLIPDFSVSDIPLEDAWRLLCNRMIEHLGVAAQLRDRPETMPRSLWYETIKLYLAMATSLLVFAGAYAPTYRNRAERLTMLAHGASSAHHWPFPLERFAERVSICTQSKLSGLHPVDGFQHESENGQAWTLWEQAIAYAGLLWRWELALLAGTEAEISNRRLLRTWMRHQRPDRRLRGWLYVLRKQGWHRSWREWKRWGRWAWQASPRYWIYGAVSEVFFRLPCLLRSASEMPEVEDVDWEELLACLPVVRHRREGNGLTNWREVASDIFWNYGEFVVSTRS